MNVDNSGFQIYVSDPENLKPIFNEEPNENNGIPASVAATFTFSCLLRADDGKYILIENAKIRGKYFRQSPGDIIGRIGEKDGINNYPTNTFGDK